MRIPTMLSVVAASVLLASVLTISSALAQEHTFTFPSQSSEWTVSHYPYWWHEADNVREGLTFNPGPHRINKLLYFIDFYYNTLIGGCGQVDLDICVNGETVASVVILEGMSSISGECMFEAVDPPVEIMYYETNTVTSGCGSIVIDEEWSTVTLFAEETTATEAVTWGGVKSLYR